MPSNILFCAVSLMLVALCWRGTHAKALPLTGSQTSEVQRCGQLARDVLSKISDLLNDKEQFNGFNCSDIPAMVNNSTTTVSACAPTVSGSSCSGPATQNMPFNETHCLVNIKADLEYYRSAVEGYSGAKSSKLTEMVKATKHMLEECNWSKSQSTATSEKLCVSENTFGNRMCLCEVVQGFQLRAVTVIRALNYIASGEHRK